MKRLKYKIAAILFLGIILAGIFKVNVEFNRTNEKGMDAMVYNSTYSSVNTSVRADVYSEISLSPDESRKLRIAYRKSPFDLRISLGDYVMYINKEAYENIVLRKNEILEKFKEIISSGIKNIKEIPVKGVNSITTKSLRRNTGE